MSAEDRARVAVESGESYSVEFKRATAGATSDNDIVLAVVCLANGSGGCLLLGVEDDGTVTGLAPRHGEQTDPHLLRAMIVNRTEPPVATQVSLIEMDGLPVAMVDVPPMTTPVGTKSGTYVRRAIRADGTPECVPYRAHEIISRGLSTQGRDYAETAVRGVGIEDLDPAEIERFRALCGRGRGDRTMSGLSDIEMLRALRLLRSDLPEGEQLNLGAVLLFGRERTLAESVPTAECLFQETRRGTLATNESIRAPLLKTAERLYDLLDVRNSEEEVMVGLQRVAVPRIPEQTLREPIANALVHRDYSELGPIRVHLTEETLRVSSPGGFPPGITLATILDDSRPRSVLLADAFKRAGFVDRAGRGVEQMYLAMLRVGRGEPDYAASNDEAVVVTVATSGADLDIVRFVLAYEERTGEVLTMQQLRVLREVKSMGPETLVELSDALRQPESLVRAQVTRLIEIGVLEARGVGRHRRHHLSAAFHRLAGSSAYVRLQDTDPIQQDQMVLSYVESFGTITRARAAELCRLSPQQARGVLKRLVEQGQLELRGERRAAHYVKSAR